MKKGFIKVSDILIKQDWGKLYIFFKDFRPTYIEFRHWENDTWHYYGVSELFDELKEGEQVPQYEVIFTSHPDSSLTYEFKRLR